jgi:hypothetical protein
MEQIVNSYNLFVDTSHAITSGSKGDDFHVNLQDSGVHAGDGQIIRVNLQEFSMNKNFFDVNATNSSFKVRVFADDGSEVIDSPKTVTLTHQNIPDLHILANDFANKVADAVAELTGKDCIASSILPAATTSTTAEHTTTTTPDGDTSETEIPSTTTTTADGKCPSVISFNLEFNEEHGLISTLLGDAASAGVRIEFDEADDTYQLLGGDRKLTSVTGAFNSISVDSSFGQQLGGTQKIEFKCLYPAQKSTTPFVYIRAPGTSNTNIETRSMSGSQTASTSDNLTNHSFILGRAKVSNFFAEFTASTGRDFFLDLKQKQLNSLELRLTDAKNRPLGRTGTHSANQTAAGTGDSQSTLGNLEFTAVLRIDIVQKKQMHYLESERTEPKVPPRFSQILQKQDGGRSNFGLAPGYG